MTRLSPITALGLAAATTLFPAVASAQQPPPAPVVLPSAAPPPAVPGAATALQAVTPTYADKTDFKAPRKATGWEPRVSLGGTFSFANNSNVAGQIDGTSVAIGLKLDAAIDYNHGDHEWRNTIQVGAGITRTPIVDEWVKTNDLLNLETTYLYHVTDKFGPFVRGQMFTTMFPGHEVHTGAQGYTITELNGLSTKIAGQQSAACMVPAGSPSTTPLPPTCNTSLSLSDGFRPLTFKESVGLFVQPYQSEPATFELRGALGAQEVIAANQLAVSATPDPTGLSVALTRLSNAEQAGPELSLSVWGAILEKRVLYKINADVMTPAVHSALPVQAPGSANPGPDTRNALALTNILLDATVSFKIVEWASLDYQFRALREPQVLDTFQVQNALLLTFGLNYGSKPAVPPPCTPAPAVPGDAGMSGAPPAPAAPAAAPPPPAAP